MSDLGIQAAATDPERTPGRADIVRLMLAAAAVLFVSLGAHELWTYEGRWAEICREMQQSGDWLHPREFGEPCYDKPPLSYWLVLAASKSTGSLDEWALRLPSALAGFLLVWLTVRLGTSLFGRSTGLLAGWMLVSAPFFAFWSRAAGAEMLNAAGIAGAMAWYVEKRDRPGFLNYFVFFSILAATSLAKGLVGAAIPLLLVVLDLAFGGGRKGRLKASAVPAALLGGMLFAAPFLLADLRLPGAARTGLGTLVHESVGRYVNAFDHVEPFYHYFEYLACYLLPWTPFIAIAAWSLLRHWRSRGSQERWVGLSVAAILLFFEASSSRRNYYILPILPFAILLAASWLASVKGPALRVWIRVLVPAGAIGAFSWFGILQPALDAGSKRELAREVRECAARVSPWNEWRVVLVNLPPSYAYYVGSARPAIRCDVDGAEAWIRRDPHTIIVAEQHLVQELLKRLHRAKLIEEHPSRPWYWNKASTRPWVGVALLPS